MKRIISIACLVVMLMSLLAISVFAAPKDDIITAAEKNIDKSLVDTYRAQAVNILNQIEVSQKQADEVVALIEKAGKVFENNGPTLHTYPKSEVDILLGYFDEACEILHMTYKITEKKNALHKGDIICVLYDENGKKIADLDGDFVNDTGATDTNVGLIVSVIALITLAGASIVIAAKKVNA